jgi:hypothetical protein
MKHSIFIFTFLINFGFLSQTPNVFHKRLGGSHEDFYEVLSEKSALIRRSNFGLPPTIKVKRAIIDSIIVMNDSTVIVITSHKFTQEFALSDYAFSEQEDAFVCSDSMLIKSLEYDSTGNWKPGRDTLVNHLLFTSKLSCIDILNKITQDYRIQNLYEHPITFIGFDCNTKDKRTKRSLISFLLSYFPKKPNEYLLFFALLSFLYFLYLNRRFGSILKKVTRLS